MIKLNKYLISCFAYVLLGVLVGCAVTKFVHSSYSIRKKKSDPIFLCG